jgi:hypothetical protein
MVWPNNDCRQDDPIIFRLNTTQNRHYCLCSSLWRPKGHNGTMSRRSRKQDKYEKTSVLCTARALEELLWLFSHYRNRAASGRSARMRWAQRTHLRQQNSRSDWIYCNRRLALAKPDNTRQYDEWEPYSPKSLHTNKIDTADFKAECSLKPKKPL